MQASCVIHFPRRCHFDSLDLLSLGTSPRPKRPQRPSSKTTQNVRGCLASGTGCAGDQTAWFASRDEGTARRGPVARPVPIVFAEHEIKTANHLLLMRPFRLEPHFRLGRASNHSKAQYSTPRPHIGHVAKPNRTSSRRSLGNLSRLVRSHSCPGASLRTRAAL